MPGALHHFIGKYFSVVSPYGMKIMTHGDHDMKIPAVKGLAFPTLQPKLGFCGTGKRAASVLTGIVH